MNVASLMEYPLIYFSCTHLIKISPLVRNKSSRKIAEKTHIGKQCHIIDPLFSMLWVKYGAGQFRSTEKFEYKKRVSQ